MNVDSKMKPAFKCSLSTCLGNHVQYTCTLSHKLHIINQAPVIGSTGNGGDGESVGKGAAVKSITAVLSLLSSPRTDSQYNSSQFVERNLCGSLYRLIATKTSRIGNLNNRRSRFVTGTHVQ